MMISLLIFAVAKSGCGVIWILLTFEYLLRKQALCYALTILFFFLSMHLIVFDIDF